jgi:hypothetical protein
MPGIAQQNSSKGMNARLFNPTRSISSSIKNAARAMYPDASKNRISAKKLQFVVEDDHCRRRDDPSVIRLRLAAAACATNCPKWRSRMIASMVWSREPPEHEKQDRGENWTGDLLSTIRSIARDPVAGAQR